MSKTVIVCFLVLLVAVLAFGLFRGRTNPPADRESAPGDRDPAATQPILAARPTEQAVSKAASVIPDPAEDAPREGGDQAPEIPASRLALKRSADASVRNPEVAATIDEVLSADAPEARIRALRKLAPSAATIPRAKMAILEALQDRDEAVRMTALSIVAAWNDPELVWRLRTIASEDPSDSIRTRATQMADYLSRSP